MRCAHCDAVIPDDAGLCLDCRMPPLLEGRYRLDDRIGRGAHGTVYRVTDFGTGDTLAAKELPLREGLDPKQQQLLEREASTLAQLDHPAIPRFHGRVFAGKGKSRSVYLLQDFVEGTSLQEELARHRYTEDEVLAIVEEVLGILAYLHGLSPPVIHRDIKPSNLMRRRSDGRLVLLDFGAVREAIQDPALGGSTVAGTFGFMAPEQFQGDAVPATDIHALAATAVALLSRRDPASLHDRSGQFSWERHVAASEGTRRLLRRMLQPDPDQRPADAAALVAEVQRLRADPSPALPIPAPEGAAPLTRRESSALQRFYPAILAGVLVGMAAMGVAGLAAMVLWPAPAPLPPPPIHAPAPAPPPPPPAPPAPPAPRSP